MSNNKIIALALVLILILGIFLIYYEVRKNSTSNPIGPLTGGTSTIQIGSCYVIDKNGVYCEDQNIAPAYRKLEGADPETFRVLDESGQYGADKNHVYSGIEVVEGADPKTFSNVRDPGNSFTFYKDAVHVFYRGRVIVGADAKTFTDIDTVTGKDKNGIIYEWNYVPNVDPGTYQVIGGSYDGYAKDKNHVFWTGYDVRHPVVIADADPVTFRRINDSNYYAIDAGHVFHKQDVINGADPATIKVLSESTRWPQYIADDSHAFVNDVVIPGADPATFTMLNSWFSKDKNHVYFSTTTIEFADSATFVVFDIKWAKDKSHVYESNGINSKYDSATFEFVKNPHPSEWVSIEFVKDKNGVYSYNASGYATTTNDGQPLAGVVPASFELVGGLYSKDGSSVFYKTQRIERADSATFKVLFDSQSAIDYAKDKNYVYKDGAIMLGADPNTFVAP